MDCVRQDKLAHNPSINMSGFYAIRHLLSLQNGCLFFGQRIVIFLNLRPRILRLLHEGHRGATRMKMLALSYVYWTNTTKDIEDYVRNCHDCQEVAKALVKRELSSWPVEERPWCRIHVDYAGPVDGKIFHAMVDAYSK